MYVCMYGPSVWYECDQYSYIAIYKYSSYVEYVLCICICVCMYVCALGLMFGGEPMLSLCRPCWSRSAFSKA